MYRYHCLNPISEVGLETFTKEYVPVSEPGKKQMPFSSEARI